VGYLKKLPKTFSSTHFFQMYKADFPFFANNPDLVYLDSAATTQKPQIVIGRITRYYTEECAPVGRSLYETGVTATQAVEEVRAQTIRFLDAPADSHIIFTSGATDSLNLLSQGFSHNLQVGDEIILSDSEHHANLVPWQQVAAATGARLLFINTDKNGNLNLEQLGETLSEKTRIVTFSLVSNVFGNILPVAEINQILDQQGSRPFFILDASQAGAHLPLSVSALNCDALVLAAHKMYAPSGVGVLWGRTPLLDMLTPLRTGGGMINKVTLPKSDWAPLPGRLEAGSPNTEGILGFGAALSYLETIGMEEVKQHTEKVHGALSDAIRDIPGISLLGEPNPASGIVSLIHERIHPHDLAQYLADHQVCVRAGHQCAQPLHAAHNLPGSLRASIGLYNSTEDAVRFADALRDAVIFFS
jgi:cysteine desulfurase/selenocysteine lyase